MSRIAAIILMFLASQSQAENTPDINSIIEFHEKNQLCLVLLANGKIGFQPGKISKSGLNFGIPETPSTFYNVDWLCGGCLMHRKENLILTNYYPLSGKAYAEDLFHSKLLRDNNVILVRSGEAKCYVDFTSSKGGSWLNIISNLQKPLIAMNIFIKSINGNITRMYLVNFFIIIRLFLIKIFKIKKY